MTSDETSRAARRTPLWLGLSLLAVALYASVLPAPNSAEGTSGRAVHSILDALVPLGGLCLLAAAGVVTAVATCGWRGVGAGWRCLLGRARESELALASRALGTAGSFVMHLGICAGFLALISLVHGARLFLEASQAGGAAPRPLGTDHFMLCRDLILLGVPGGILAGRFLLGATAEAAALRAGVKPPSFAASVQLLAVLIVPILVSLFFLRFPTLSD